MKKTLVTCIAVGGLALGAFAQGSLSGFTSVFSADGITTPGANASDPTQATTWYTGSVSVELFYASSNSVSSSQINAINALSGTAGGGAAALALLGTDGFTLASASPFVNSLTTGALTYGVTDGGISSGPDGVGLLGVPTGGTGWIAMYAVGNAADAYNGYSGVISWLQGLGGNPNQLPTPGLPTATVTDPSGINLVLTTSVPEPSSLALAGLGGFGMLMAMRRKKA